MLLESLSIFIFCILLIYLLLCGYIKIKYPFWSTQPVYHSYSFIPPQGRISYELFAINKYVNLVDIKTFNVEAMDDTMIIRVCNFIKTYKKTKQISTKQILTKQILTKTNIMGDLECSNYQSYITIYKKPKMLFDKHNNNSFMYIDEYISVITARILHMTLKGIKTIPLYYIDNLCVHQDHRKKGIAPEMIATHCYNMSRLQCKVVTYLLCGSSSSSDMDAIVPLTTFITREYDISQFYFMSFPIGSVSLIEITKKNISLFTHFIHQHNKFNCIILPEISNIQHLLKTGNIYIYGIIQSRELISIYIFKKISKNIDSDSTMNCIASLYIDGLSSDIFIIGFNQALQQISKRDNTIKRIMIENTSHNASIIEYAKRINIRIICEYPSAFFLYNYGCYSYQPSECFFIY